MPRKDGVKGWTLKRSRLFRGSSRDAKGPDRHTDAPSTVTYRDLPYKRMAGADKIYGTTWDYQG